MFLKLNTAWVRDRWKASRIPWRLLAVIYTLMLFTFNFIGIYNNVFWGDECFSIRLSKMTVKAMLKAAARDVHPPFYYFITIVAYRIFGDQSWVYHAVSLLPYAIGLVFILTVIWKRFGKGTAFLMVTFASVFGAAMEYNVEAIML